MPEYILSLDQGTTSSRAVVFDRDLNMISAAQEEFEQIFPHPGWVEHNPIDIWNTQLSTAEHALNKAGPDASSVAAIGVTNQRETTILWDRKTGKPVCNAVVWQDRRTSTFCDDLKKQGLAELIRNKTGLVIDAYFSASKLKWLLDNLTGVRSKAERGELAFGTVDAWIIWNLTAGQLHLTDHSNASRTMLYNLHNADWDDELLEIFDIPRVILPKIVPSSGICGKVEIDSPLKGIPIAGIAGDQQAALFGQACFKPGMMKNTYGTGGFLMLNTGDVPSVSENNLLTTVAWNIAGKNTYALEGSVFIAGAVVQWLRDGLGIIKSSSEIETLANSVNDNGGVTFVPAFTGLGAPNWDPSARGTIIGLTRGTNKGHIARAALESIAFQIDDVLQAMESDAGFKVKELRVDGGAAANNTLLQFQSDISDRPLVRPAITETTALGAAMLAGYAAGMWKDLDELSQKWQADREFRPAMPDSARSKLIAVWHNAIARSKNWAE
ncbi:MAG: glycerol kinase GlpK [FCB group bacterium]|nr:glycerol kinase GlpK [FCB group bacterium]